MLRSFADGMRVGGSGLTVLLSGTVYPLLAQMPVAAHMGVGEAAAEENAYRKHDDGNSQDKKSQKKDFFHKDNRISRKLLYLCGANLRRNR